MKNFKSFGFIAAVIVLSACGSQSTRDQWNYNNGDGTTTGSTTGTTGIQTGDNNQNVGNLPPAPEQRVELSGQNGSNPNYSISLNGGSGTSRTLRVKITPLSAPNVTIPGYSNWVFPYGCLQVTVVVNGITKMTQVLRVNGMAQSSQCANAPTYEILDFTNQMTGSGNVTVTVQNAVYDNCRYNWPMYYGCYMSQVWQNHRVAMNVQIQTNGTWMSN